ncbi:MAG: adenylate kinase family protein, partial [Dehalococcoidia bacterium]
QFLREKLKTDHLSSGDLFRFHLQQGTPLGTRVAEYMNQGLLVPDEVTIDIILDKVLAFPEEGGFVLDGFPRTPDQAKALEQALQDKSRDLDKVLFINVPEAELVRRLSNRYVCRGCQAPYAVEANDPEAVRECERCGGELYQRPDDRPEAVQQRISVFQQETAPVLDFYRAKGLLADVSGVGSVECVNRRILEALDLDLD